MKAIKKSLSIILALIFIVQIVPFSAFAEEPESQPEPEVIVNQLPDEGGYVPEEPELLEPEEPESGDPEATDLEEPLLYRDGLKIGIFNPNIEGTVEYKTDNGNWTSYSQPFYLDAYQTASVSARVTLNNEQAVTTENICSNFEELFEYSDVVSDFCLKYKTVDFDFARVYQNDEWFFATDSNVSADASGYFYNGILPNGTEMIFVKVNQTTYQNPTTGYVLNVLYSGSTLNGYTITIDNVVYTYNAAGQIAEVHSIYGDSIEISRTSSSIEISDGANRTYTITLDTQGNPASITDPIDGTITYTYSNGALSTVTDQSGVVIGNYQYSAGKLLKSGDKTIDRDTMGRVTSIVHDSGAYENYTYDNTLNKVITSTSTNNKTVTCYNEAGEVLSTTDEANNTSVYTYDADYNLLTETVDGVLTTTNTYSNGLLATSTDSDNLTTTYTYTNGRIATEKTGNTITEYTYTQEGELESVETREEIHESAGGDAGVAEITINIIDDVEYVYDDGLLIETIDNKNHESVEYSYDEYGNVTAKDVTVTGENPSTAHTSSTYDLVGNLLTESDGTNTTTYVYDAAGRTLRVTAAGEVTRTVYDGQGRVVQEIGPEDYDAEEDGLPSSTAYSDNTVGTRYVYATNGTLTSETDRLGRTTTYTYNATGSKVKEAFDIYEYYYLNHGEKWKTTIAGSVYLTCTYSNDGKYRLLQESYANGNEKNYTYNAHGDIIEIEDENDNTLFAFTYDTDNVLTEKLDYQRGLTYTYDGDTVEVYKTSDNTLLYSYENTSQEGENEPTTAEETHFGTVVSTESTENEVTYASAQHTTAFEDTVENDRITQTALSYDNNAVISFGYTYDSDDNITAKNFVLGGDNVSFTYTYDTDNRITAEGISGQELNHYTYNASDQLIRANNAVIAASYTYAYDSRGNILTKKGYETLANDLSALTPDTQTTFTYAASGWTDKLTQVKKAVKVSTGELYDYEFNNVTYDSIGNVLTYGNTSYTWENGRNLVGITQGNNIYSYTYDEEGIRTSKTVNGTTTYFNYEGGQLLSQSDGTNTLIFQYDASGNPAGFLYNGTQYFYITNPMGDVQLIVDKKGNYVAQYYYLDAAWGSYTEIDGANSDARAIARLNPIRYKGYYYDNETGYYYLQSRYYDPEICRFINADCYCDTGTGTVYSTNMFAYCENDPVNYDDPSGEYFSPLQAQKYANNYWRDYNKGYNVYPNHDCTNFVSQCLHAGGIKMDELWHSYRLKKGWDVSKAWRSNHYLIPYLRLTNHIKVSSDKIKTFADIKIGLKKIKGKDKSIKTCSFIIVFYEYSKMVHTAINGYVANKYTDVDYFAHTIDRFGYDCVDTVKDYLRKNEDPESIKYSVAFYRIK